MAKESLEEKGNAPAVETSAAPITPAKSNTAPVELERDNDDLLYRYSDVSAGDVIGSDTFQIAAASEFPGLQRAGAAYARLGIAKEGDTYTEILSHDESDVDLSFLNSGRAAFLDEHKTNRHLGKILKANLSSDKVTRVLVKCDGASKLSKTRQKQLAKKSRVNVSLGYVHTRYLGTVKLPDGITGHRFAFQAREVSSVGDPLDSTVGLERAAATDKCACFGCGKQMKCSDMICSDDALYCSQDCVDAETPAEDDDARTVQEKTVRAEIPPAQTAIAVDSTKSVTAEKSARSTQIEPTKNFMAKTIAELKTEAPELVTEIESTTRTATEKSTRAAVTAENEARSKKREPLVKELRALADAFVKDHGRNWAGKAGEVVVVGERIRAFEQEAIGSPEDHSDSEIRTDFKNKANELIRSSRAPKNQEEAANLPQELAGRCSFMRAVQSAIENSKGVRTTALMPGDGAELEAHQEITRKLPSYPGGTRILENGGFFLPPNMPAPVQNRSAGVRQTRDALAMDFATAGATIQPDFRPMIELLRNELVCARLGATFLGGLIGDVIFPRQEAATVAQSLAEGAQLQPYDQVLGQIRMSPHRVGSRQYYSRLAVLQSSLDFEAFVLNDHMQVIAIYLDYLALNGTGAADQPLGVLNQPGINQVIFGGTPTYAQLVQFRTLIRSFNINGPIGFVTSSVGQGRLSVLPAGLVGATLVSGINSALWLGDEANGTLIGASAIASQQIPGNILLSGVFKEMLIASWGGVNVVIDNLTRADRDEIAITTNTYMDTAVRHAQAFTRSADTVNQ